MTEEIRFTCLDCKLVDYPMFMVNDQLWDKFGFYPKFECDSIKGDTFWKDGNRIVAKNIINVSFK